MRNTIPRIMFCNAPKSRQSIQLILDQEKGKGDTVGLVNKSKMKITIYAPMIYTAPRIMF